jgi:hypothetical protein
MSSASGSDFDLQNDKRGSEPMTALRESTPSSITPRAANAIAKSADSYSADASMLGQ